MKRIVSFLLLLQTFLYGLEVDMVRYELIHQRKSDNLYGKDIRIGENKNVYVINDIDSLTNENHIRKYNSNGELLWSKGIEKEPLALANDTSMINDFNYLLNIEYFKNHIYAFSVYYLVKNGDKGLYTYEIAKYKC